MKRGDKEVKRNASELMKKALRSKRRKCMIRTDAMSDPDLLCGENLSLARQCLKVVLQYGFGATVRPYDCTDEIGPHPSGH